jgi:hypothetical protein
MRAQLRERRCNAEDFTLRSKKLHIPTMDELVVERGPETIPVRREDTKTENHIETMQLGLLCKTCRSSNKQGSSNNTTTEGTPPEEQEAMRIR